MFTLRLLCVVIIAFLLGGSHGSAHGDKDWSGQKRFVLDEETPTELYIQRLEARLNATIATVAQLQAELNEEKHKRCQAGSANFHKVECGSSHCQESLPIVFHPYFAEAPLVHVALVSIDSEHGANLRIGANVDNITPSSAVIHVGTWADTVLYSGTVSWIACPK